jgi:Rrf2 family protein
VTTQKVAAATLVPVGYLSKVLQALGKAGLVDAQRGLRGGYVLARPLDELTVLEVINSVDPLQRITGCPLGLNAHGGTLCSLHSRLDEGIALIESLFQGTTIDQLVGRSAPGRSPLCDVLSEVDGRTPIAAARPIVDGERPSLSEPD